MTTEKDVSRAIFADNLNALLNQKGITLSELARYMDVQAPSAHAWLHGKAVPRATKLKKLASWLGVSTDYLLGKHDTNGDTVTRPIDDLIQELFADDGETLQALTLGAYAESKINTLDGTVYAISDEDKTMLKNAIHLVLRNGREDKGQ